MRFLRHFCLFVVVYSVIELCKRAFQVLLGSFLMDYYYAPCIKFFPVGDVLGGGFFFLWLFFMFLLGLWLFQFTWHGKELVQFFFDVWGKSRGLRKGFCSKNGLGGVFDSKIPPYNGGSLASLENPKPKHDENLLMKKQVFNPYDTDSDDDHEQECGVEDGEFDVIALRRMVKIERLRASMIYADLEKERRAAASAADEAMSMILRLQSEKSSLEIEFNQYRKLAEQKQEYDQQVIHSLKWIIMKHESATCVLEEKLRLCKEKLKHYMKDEIDKFENFDASLSSVNSTMEDGLEEILDIDSTIEDGSKELPNI
ncbi:hypothetical protein K2173_009197 [Erythroxylum novogranatense]|uniref:GTD-binding domain-containing protein n=1 Tax=Erythroxylum novogranatense TaxID=1862640 RepID=A0AAV8TDD1_9ROSI|nr:hypothetical protein K2173_009197 [Erythroxylum novogranatense]